MLELVDQIQGGITGASDAGVVPPPGLVILADRNSDGKGADELLCSLLRHPRQTKDHKSAWLLLRQAEGNTLQKQV